MSELDREKLLPHIRRDVEMLKKVQREGNLSDFGEGALVTLLQLADCIERGDFDVKDESK
jgi:hypothetical protein